MFVAQHLSSYKIKILIVGASDSGKIALCSKYTNGFSKIFEESLGVDIFVREQENPDGEEITYACWVCAPQKRFEYYWPKFFRGASGAFIMFDTTNRDTFNDISFWCKKIRKNLGSIPIILLGNKIDIKDKRVVEFEEAKKISDQLKLAAYIEISVKEDINVSASFELLNEIIYSFLNSDTGDFNPKDIQKSIKLKINKLNLDHW